MPPIPLRYRNLSDIEKIAVCNGCGSKGGPISPPNWIFKASCNQHDFNYWLGNKEKDRKKADKQFLVAMLEDAEDELRWTKRVWYKLMANTYYRAVRLGGTIEVLWPGKKPYFHYAKKKRDRRDLKRSVARYLSNSS